MAYPAFQYISPEEYLAMELNASDKHEYFEGTVYAMAGASENHDCITANLCSEIQGFIKGKGCRAHTSAFRITTPHFESYMYPDVSIVRGKAEKKEGVVNTFTNPSVIIEVTSKSTEKYDRGYKQIYYLQIPSLKEYIIVDSLRCNVEINRKNQDGDWAKTTINDMDGFLSINTIDMQLQMKDIYFEVSFENGE